MDTLKNLKENEFDEKTIRLSFKTIKGKPNRQPDKFSICILKDVCQEVTFQGAAHLRVRSSSPVELRAFNEFCRAYLGDFPTSGPYTYIPKSVLVQQPKKQSKKRRVN